MHIVHLFVGIDQFHLKPAYEIVKIPVEELVLIKTPKPEEIIEKIKSRARDDSIEATMTTSIAVGEMKQEAATQLESDKNTSMLSRAKTVLRKQQSFIQSTDAHFQCRGDPGCCTSCNFAS